MEWFYCIPRCTCKTNKRRNPLRNSQAEGIEDFGRYVAATPFNVFSFVNKLIFLSLVTARLAMSNPNAIVAAYGIGKAWLNMINVGS